MSVFPDPFDNRVAIIGKTGTGKTTVAAALTGGLSRALFIDPKHSPQMARTFTDLEPWLGPSPKRRPSFRNTVRALATRGLDNIERSLLLQRRMENGEPFRAWLRPPPGYDYEALWQYIFTDLRRVTVYIDEVYLTLKTRGRSGMFFHALYTQGREREIGVWACMQRPAWVPVEALSECEWFYIFRLIKDDDKRAMKGAVGEVALRPLHGHQFLVYNDATERADMYDGIAQGA